MLHMQSEELANIDPLRNVEPAKFSMDESRKPVHCRPRQHDNELFFFLFFLLHLFWISTYQFIYFNIRLAGPTFDNLRNYYYIFLNIRLEGPNFDNLGRVLL